MTCAATLIVDAMPGGDIHAFVRMAEYIDCVQVRGWCGSACTILLSAERACVHDNAELLFHGTDSGRDSRDFLNAVIMSLDWPERLRAWFLDGPWRLKGADYATLTGSETQSMGVMGCDKPAPQ